MASPAKTLTEEQRQQIITKLLAERRSKGGRQSCAAEVDEERTKRVQQLLASRAAARQNVQGGPLQKRVSLDDYLADEQSLDALLSPGSTCSLRSNAQAAQDRARESAATVRGGTSSSRQHTTAKRYSFTSDQHTQQQHQQHCPSRLQAAAPPVRETVSHSVDGPVDVSRLWEAPEWPSEQISSLSLGEEGEASYRASAFDHSGAEGQDSQEQLWQQYDQQQARPQQQGVQQHQLQQPWQQQPEQQPQQRQQWQLQQQRLSSHHQLQQHQQQPDAPQQQQQATQQQQCIKKQQQQQQQRPRLPSPARQCASLPPGYPTSAEERLLQLAKPKSANCQKYEQMKQAADLDILQHCSFAPRTGRGPQHQLGHSTLPVTERLYLTAAERQAKLERKAAEQQASSTDGCTFKPQTNRASHEKYLAAYEYVPIHKRLGEVLRSKNEKLAQIQLEVERQNRDATFMPKINPRSSVLALRRSRQLGSEISSSPHQGNQVRDSSRGLGSLRRSRSEADLLAQQQEYSFTPRINRNSKAMLQASGEIPAGFLERQEYFDRLASEKKQLLQLAIEDQHCSFIPGASTSDLALGHSTSSYEDESYLERIERLAYQDSRKKEAARAALAELVHSSECTFRPAINPRSQRIAQATPLYELYENTKGKMKRGAAALAVQMQREEECTFSPNLQKPGVPQSSPVEAKLSLSASEVDAVVHRLHSAKQSKEDKIETAISFKQYQELKQCTFAPEINKEVPKQQGPVLVRGLGRYMELKEMAKRQAEQKAAVEAKVFMTNIHAKAVPRPFTVPQPFRLGRSVESAEQEEQRRAQAEAAAQQYADRECTFKPQINSSHQTRQQRVQQLLQLRASAGR